MRKLFWAVLLASLAAMLPLLTLRISNEQKNTSVLLAGEAAPYFAAASVKEPNGLRSAAPVELRFAGLNAMIADESFLSETGLLSQNSLREMDVLQQTGFEIILRLQTLDHSDIFYKQVEQWVDRFSIRYLLMYPEPQEDTSPQPYVTSSLQSAEPITRVSGQTTPTAFSRQLEQLIKRRGLTLFLMENEAQTGFSELPGLSSLIPAAEYRINRAFSIHSSLLKRTDPENALYVWRRAVIDRNIRLIDITGAGTEPSFYAYTPENLQRIKKLQTDLLKRGFSAANSLSQLNTRIPGFAYKIPILINLISAIALYLSYLLPSRSHRLHWVLQHIRPTRTKGLLLLFFLLLLLLCLTPLINMAANLDMGIFLAFLSALIYPSLSSLFLLRILGTGHPRLAKPIIKYALPTAAVLLINFAGAAAVLASMADIRYTMHLINFNIVIPAFLIPLATFTLHFLICRGLIHRQTHKPIHHWLPDIAGIVLLTGALFFYIQRSGNDSLLPAQSLELEVRNLLETIFYARPRSKEFLIGYPALFLFLFLYAKPTSNRLLFVLGLLASVTSVSILNSFCHGFTPAAVSLLRSLEALLLGCISGAAAVCLESLRRLLYNTGIYH